MHGNLNENLVMSHALAGSLRKGVYMGVFFYDKYIQNL